MNKFPVHIYSTIFMIVHKEFIFSYGFDSKMAKFNFKSKSLDSFVETENKMTAMKLLKISIDD